ncbi:hypothetical protein QTP88_016061 [Uroleucon formosanum]
MPKTKSNLGSSITRWIESYNRDKTVFTTSGLVIYCQVCDRQVRCNKKFQITQHVTTEFHLKCLKKSSNNSKQMLMGDEIKPKTSSFNEDLCLSLIAANIPWFKLQNPVFHDFLQNYTRKHISDESTLRKSFLHPCYLVSKVFLKAPQRVYVYKEIMPSVPLPPEPVLTRWGTWIKAANFCADHFDNLKIILQKLEDKNVYKKFGTLTMCDSIQIVSNVILAMEKVPGQQGKIIQEKLLYLIEKNVGFQTAKQITAILSGKENSIMPPNVTPSMCSCMKFAPITSVDIERTFENKIWRVICGPVYDNEKRTWRKKYNKELHEEMEMASIVSFIKGQRIQWLGHMWRRSEHNINRVVLEWKPTGKRPRGRPRKRWLDVVKKDLYRIGVQDWKELAQDRDKWRDLVMAV